MQNKISFAETFGEYESTTKEKGDFPMTVQECLEALQKSGLKAAPLYVHGHRAFIVGRK